MDTKYSTIANNKLNFINYGLLYLLLAVTGMPYFYMYKPFLWLSSAIVLVVFLIKKEKFDKNFFFYIGFVLLVQLGQVITFLEFPMETLLGLHVRIVLAYCVIKMLKERLPEYYVKMLFFFTIISFIFYFPGLLIPGFNNFLVYKLAPALDYAGDYYKNLPYRPNDNIIIFCMNTFDWDYYRNSGPFWEPGAFGGFLTIALLFNIIKEKKLIEKKNIVFIVGLITTFSTTAYIVLGLLITVYLFVQGSKVKGVILFLIMIPLFYYSFTSLDFLQNKISEHLFLSSRSNDDITRFTSALLDWEMAKKYPLFGSGTSFSALGMDKSSLWTYQLHRNNGVFNLMAIYGFPLFIFYFYLMHMSFKKLCNIYAFNYRFAFLSVIILLAIGFSEVYFSLPFFIGLTMMGFIINDRNKVLI